jgi:hypothetical protein
MGVPLFVFGDAHHARTCFDFHDSPELNEAQEDWPAKPA